MQEESRWRYALAQQIASHAHANPHVAAVLVEGSVARGSADRSSDLDLAVFWARPPTAQERRDIITRALERDSHPWSSFRTAAGWQTRTVRAGGAIDVRHTTVAAIEGATGNRGRVMLTWVVTFLIIALIAGILGFGGIAGASVEIAKAIFFIAVILFLISAVVGLVRGRTNV